LVAEIDKVLKKVSEGVQTFEETLEKIETSTNANQKDKYESDLKKEIKKLQRLRDQIKTWISSNDIKDKRALTENRKLIEQQMERFKAIEKEMKTKAYSREGLIMSGRLDPKEKEKAEMCSWITERVEALTIQIEAREAEVETLQAGAKKGKGSQAKEKMLQLEDKIERHKWHQGRLELILRLLENGQIDTDKVTGIQEDVNYYVDENMDPDFAEDEEIYSDLNLEEEEEFYAVGMEDHSHHDDERLKDEYETPPKKHSKDPEPESSSAKPAAKTIPTKSISPNRQPPTPRVASVESPIQPTQQLSQVPPTHSASPPLATAEPEIRLPTALADLAHSFEAAKERAMSKEVGFFVHQMLDASYLFIPELADTERPKHYTPKNPYPTPSYYPQTPPPGLFDNPAMFEKFDIDTLFFIFYYQQGTYQQYLAAKELKKQSWRFHKKYLTWFQRHEEPKVITEDYEQGTYIYFDYEGAWCQRKKTDFRFEYKFLEDSELV
ncbi:Not1 N-terminal domain, CCR4-Not complex component-domain-containing protein, partial [Mortierella sp. GBAus27b]